MSRWTGYLKSTRTPNPHLKETAQARRLPCCRTHGLPNGIRRCTNAMATRCKSKKISKGTSMWQTSAKTFSPGTLGSKGSPKNPTLWVLEESRFYSYDTETGLYTEQTEHALAARLSPMMLQCAREANGVVDTGNLI